MKKVCICGGGNLGHVVAGFLAANRDCDVSLFTRHPERWQHQLEITTPEGEVMKGQINTISSNPNDVICNADIVLLCLPGFSISDVLKQIAPELKIGTAVGSIVSSTGFFFEAFRILPAHTPLFGFQRVPFIARTVEYGHSAALLGYKPSIQIAIEQAENKDSLRQTIEHLFATPTTLLDSYYEVSLTNSNPILHPSRLYSMWNQWHKSVVYPTCPLFYEEWTNEASELLIAMDNEFFQLLHVLPIRRGSIPTILDYYESRDASSLTHKLRSIPAFKGILSPMKEVEGGFIPDFQSRYFTEDFPYGLEIISRQAAQHKIDTPTINQVLKWGLQHIAQK
jgi:hypothetical protein